MTRTASSFTSCRLALAGAIGRKFEQLLFAALCWSVQSAVAIIPPPERILPDDTLVLISAPDFAKLRELAVRLPQAQCWRDPAMKAFADKFASKWGEEFVKPLERELDVKFDDYALLLQGQLTLAVTQNGWQGGSSDPAPGLVILLDARGKGELLKKDLANLRKKWIDAGKSQRSEKIRDLEFTILSLSSNDVPKTLQKLLPHKTPVEELADEKDAKKPAVRNDLILGQFESMLILGTEMKSLEKVVARLTGGSVPPLADVPAFQASYQSLFRDAPLFGWANAKILLDGYVKQAAERQENPDAPNPIDIKAGTAVQAVGLNSLKTLAFALQDSKEGELVQFFLGVPEASRQGMFKVLAGEAKECRTPAFVPGDVAKFRRWRLDGQKLWQAVEKIASDISPQALSTINFMIDTANTAAREKDPGFDLRKNLIANLGDDVITYQKSPRGTSAPELKSPPAIYLVGSPNADQLAAALKSIFVFVSQQAGTAPEEREFLGRKVYSIPLQTFAMSAAGTGGAGNSVSFHYAAAGGYVAMGWDVAILEEYLRSSESQSKSLRDNPGLTEAAQKVLGPGTSLFGYRNESESMRVTVESLRAAADPGTNSPGPLQGAANIAGLNLSGTTQQIHDWLDFSLLPSFDKISKYFYFSVYGGSATPGGLTLKLFYPAPPGLKSTEPVKH